jgi:hypothetical protein
MSTDTELQNLIALFDSASPESVKYNTDRVDTSWMTVDQKVIYAEQLTGVITESATRKYSDDSEVYMFYYDVAHATDLQRLIAFERFMQIEGI